MGKKLIGLLTAAFILSCFTGCNATEETKHLGDSSVILDSSSLESNDHSTVSQDQSSDTSLDINSTSKHESSFEVSNSAEKILGIYGKTEIPDIPCGDIDFEGKASTMTDHDALEKCLDSMVFETHSFGDYTVNLVGDSVRTDKKNFPDSIYTQHLRVEVKKNGEAINGSGNYNGMVMYICQFRTEYKLLTDKIGNYLTVYDLDTPVIAMRYYYNDKNRAITKAVQFIIIQNDELFDSFVGVCAKDTGIVFNPDLDSNDPKTMLALNPDDGTPCLVSVFAADDFNVVDGKTLTDDELGIKYTFNFSDPPQMKLYTTEKIV